MLQEAGQIQRIQLFWPFWLSQYIQCLHLMYAEVAWVLVSSGTQVPLQIILDPDCLRDDLSISYDYDWNKGLQPYRNNIESQYTTLRSLIDGWGEGGEGV